MKILIVDVNFGGSSTGKLVESLKIMLEVRGHSVQACYGRTVKNQHSGGIRISNDLEVLAHVGLTRLTGFTGSYSPVATRSLMDVIEDFNPDVVHLHELHGYYINYPVIVKFLKERKIPTVWTFHCEFMYTGKCGYAYDCEQWRTECVRCPQVHEYPVSWLFDRTNFMFNQKKSLLEEFRSLRIVTPSEWLADRVRKSFLSNNKIEVVYNGVDTGNIFTPSDSASLKDRLGIKTKYVVLSVAPDLMSERKGGRWILEVAKRLCKKDITFVMVGVDIPNEISMSNVIALSRITDQKELAQYYSMADVLLLTSQKETFSLVCAESLACGTPIIGFEAGAPGEVAPAGYGYFVPYGDIDSLCNSMIENFEGVHLFVSGENCRDYARANFGLEVMISKYENIYSEMQVG
jgi:putative colanic acid biosynthesis glycosyltransferase